MNWFSFVHSFERNIDSKTNFNLRSSNQVESENIFLFLDIDLIFFKTFKMDALAAKKISEAKEHVQVAEKRYWKWNALFI